ncbi:MAG TPA: dockerin type I domain-containing protein [Pirellulales bacterium]|nr:dockerin type I domain-containing protein [Pirellulales bacterium]
MTLITSLGEVRAQNLTLTVDPYSGAASITNPAGAPVNLDGYQITSASGQLSTTGWNSLTHRGLTGWQTIAPTTANALSELNLTSYTAVPASGSVTLGDPFKANGTEDVHWGYSSPTGTNTETSVNPAPVVYAGGLQVQAITVVSSTNAVQATHLILLNQETSPSFNVDAYVIQSAGGALNPANFTGYASRNTPGWQSVAPSANALSELNLTSSSTLAPHQDLILGSAFTAGGPQDLSLQFHLTGTSTAALNGTVVYQTMLAGDANGDGIVNSQDIALISSNWLASNSLPGDVNFDGIVNSQDIALISSNWLQSRSPGSGMASGAQSAPVPEPSSLILLAGGLSTVGLLRYRRKEKREHISKKAS